MSGLLEISVQRNKQKQNRVEIFTKISVLNFNARFYFILYCCFCLEISVWRNKPKQNRGEIFTRISVENFNARSYFNVILPTAWLITSQIWRFMKNFNYKELKWLYIDTTSQPTPLWTSVRIPLWIDALHVDWVFSPLIVWLSSCGVFHPTKWPFFIIRFYFSSSGLHIKRIHVVTFEDI